uniref:Uncharacterized protein n=1 Tax=Periophthalmus magnuspinnatus TaxID=409849 RepID=A0A3B3ZRV7_9GOBI
MSEHASKPSPVCGSVSWKCVSDAATDKASSSQTENTSCWAARWSLSRVCMDSMRAFILVSSEVRLSTFEDNPAERSPLLRLCGVGEASTAERFLLTFPLAGNWVSCISEGPAPPNAARRSARRDLGIMLQLMQCVLSYLMDLLLVLEKHPLSPSTTPSRRSASRHDDVLRMVLTQMEGEHKLALRRVYASALPPLVDRCGITVCRHLKRLERVILEYLELSDPPDETSRIHILLTLNQTLQTAWPRVNQRRGQQLLKAVLRLLVDVSSDINLKDSVKREIFDQSAASIRLLDVCSNRTLQVLKYMY